MNKKFFSKIAGHLLIASKNAINKGNCIKANKQPSTGFILYFLYGLSLMIAKIKNLFK